MNVFLQNNDVDQCSQYHCDQHVGKTFLESVQLLCSALNKEYRLPALPFTPFEQTMPDQHKQTNDSIAAYRRFYCVEKSAFATWTKCE
jgi:hypothetical protein